MPFTPIAFKFKKFSECYDLGERENPYGFTVDPNEILCSLLTSSYMLANTHLCAQKNDDYRILNMRRNGSTMRNYGMVHKIYLIRNYCKATRVFSLA
jgi:hypothetical protein